MEIREVTLAMEMKCRPVYQNIPQTADIKSGYRGRESWTMFFIGQEEMDSSYVF